MVGHQGRATDGCGHARFLSVRFGRFTTDAPSASAARKRNGARRSPSAATPADAGVCRRHALPAPRRACALRDRGAPSMRPTRVLAVTVPLRDGLFRRNVRVARLYHACCCRMESRPSSTAYRCPPCENPPRARGARRGGFRASAGSRRRWRSTAEEVAWSPPKPTERAPPWAAPAWGSLRTCPSTPPSAPRDRDRWRTWPRCDLRTGTCTARPACRVPAAP